MSKSDLNRLKFPFWLKLASFASLLTSLILIGVFSIISIKEKSNITERLIQELDQKERFRDRIESNRIERLRTAADELKYNSTLVSFIRDSVAVSADDLFGFAEDEADESESLRANSEKILSALEGNYKIYEESEVFILVNANGEVLLNKQNTHMIGEDLSQWPAVASAMKQNDQGHSDWWMGQSHVKYLPTKEENRLFSITPFSIKDQSGVYGVLIVGFELGDSYSKQFQFKGEVPFFLNYIQDGILLGSDLSGEAKRDLMLKLKKSPDLKDSILKMNHFKLTLDSQEYIGRISIEKDSEGKDKKLLFLKNFSQPLNSQIESFLNALMPWALCAIVMTLLLSVMLAKRLTRPIQGLIHAVGRIGLGDFSTRVEVDSHDEMAVLGRAINEMGQDLETGRFIEGAMKQYVPSELVDDLKENQNLMDLGGDRQTLSIFFSDIVGFTSISEKLKPEELIELLNSYLSEMGTMVSNNKGTIDKFIGDAVMAFWNAPRSLEGHPNYAATTALEQLRFLRKGTLIEGLKEKGIDLQCRIGIHYGDAIVGNVGSDQRRDYTIIGDSVNLASRLEGSNNQYGTLCVISEPFRLQLSDEFVTRPLDKVVVKGKTEPVMIHELVEKRPYVTNEQLEHIAFCDRMIQAYWNRDFNGALAMLNDTKVVDPLVELYRERCRLYQASPPPKDWNGAWVMTTK